MRFQSTIALQIYSGKCTFDMCGVELLNGIEAHCGLEAPYVFVSTCILKEVR